jgi:hypothetical protein
MAGAQAPITGQLCAPTDTNELPEEPSKKWGLLRRANVNRRSSNNGGGELATAADEAKNAARVA